MPLRVGKSNFLAGHLMDPTQHWIGQTVTPIRVSSRRGKFSDVVTDLWSEASTPLCFMEQIIRPLPLPLPPFPSPFLPSVFSIPFSGGAADFKVGVQNRIHERRERKIFVPPTFPNVGGTSKQISVGAC